MGECSVLYLHACVFLYTRMYMYVCMRLCVVCAGVSVFGCVCLWCGLCVGCVCVRVCVCVCVYHPGAQRTRKKRCPYTKYQIRELEREFFFSVYINKEK